MKREILCADCAPQLAAAFDSLLPARLAMIELGEGECFRFEHGPLLAPVRCDHCNRELDTGVGAWCVSLWSTTAGIPWSRWETEYIATHGGEP